MKRNHSIVAASLGTVALVAAFTLSGGGAAYASAPSPDPSAAPLQSCWIEASTQQSLCVPTGEDLLAAVQEQDGITIDVPVGTSVSGRTVTAASSLATQFRVASATVTEPVSIIYDNINYGGGSLIMSSVNGCNAGISSLVPFGWNDRASSFKSFSGCVTALYVNINYGGSHVGYSSSKSSFGSLNDTGSSWATN